MAFQIQRSKLFAGGDFVSLFPAAARSPNNISGVLREQLMFAGKVLNLVRLLFRDAKTVRPNLLQIVDHGVSSGRKRTLPCGVPNGPMDFVRQNSLLLLRFRP
jgi:hypothetical protein